MPPNGIVTGEVASGEQIVVRRDRAARLGLEIRTCAKCTVNLGPHAGLAQNVVHGEVINLATESLHTNAALTEWTYSLG